MFLFYNRKVTINIRITGDLTPWSWLTFRIKPLHLQGISTAAGQIKKVSGYSKTSVSMYEIIMHDIPQDIKCQFHELLKGKMGGVFEKTGRYSMVLEHLSECNVFTSSRNHIILDTKLQFILYRRHTLLTGVSTAVSSCI
jgi:hypothetical protein